MSATLIIECSTPRATVALVDGHELTQREFTSDRNHNALLFEPLQALLDAAPREGIGLVLVGSGPGSYSGTRVGIAAAQGVALALGCPVAAVPSILAVPAADDGAPCLAIGDARRGSFWTSMVRGLQLEAPPELGDAASLGQAVTMASEQGVAVFAFEGAERFPVAAGLQGMIRNEFPDATRLWKAWQAQPQAVREAWLAEVPQPIYLKPPHITPGKRKRLIDP